MKSIRNSQMKKKICQKRNTKKIILIKNHYLVENYKKIKKED